MKVIINECFGGFGLSKFGWDKLMEIKNDNTLKSKDPNAEDFRYDKDLIYLLETYGSNVIGGFYSSLKIVDIEKDTKFRICEYDGLESIETMDSIDWIIAE